MLPSPSILDAPPAEPGVSERELMGAARLLEETYARFGVAGSVTRICPGPVVSTFEFEPAPGVTARRASSLADDLSLAMSVESVRIEQVRGHAAVDVQLPNRRRQPTSLRELLESEAYRRSGSGLALALGRTSRGDAFVAGLASMPHLLLAGASGTGKSMALNAMIASILFRATPDTVRLILIARSALELGLYEDIPHLLTPVIANPKRATYALVWAVREAERRQKAFAAEGVPTIDGHNRNARRGAASQRAEICSRLPYIVVVIDELADLMDVADRMVEASVARLAQMGEAVGIHLLLATGRPSGAVITDGINRSVRARVALRVSSKRESQTILDRNGAEQLLGGGDMLFRPSHSSRLIRLHGPYISEQETARLAAFLREQGKPVYDRSVVGGQPNPRSA
jgi:DNA segregation ATPase FtsK/SpoIIIE, S-DNA-T family